MSKHTLSLEEIKNIPAGRIMNIFIEEYVFDRSPQKFNSSTQKIENVHWFEEHSRACAEDDGGYCSADGLAKYSTDVSIALKLSEKVGKSLHTKTEIVCPTGFSDPQNVYWATFSEVPFVTNDYYGKLNWSSANSLALAICRAALIEGIYH